MATLRVRRTAPILLVLAFFAMGMAQVRTASLTFDEGPHLAVGYTTLRTRDLRLQPVHIHPPLANVVAALPLLLQSDLPDPSTVEGWQHASLSAITEAVVWQHPHPAHIATAGRVPILLSTTLLVALVYRWACDLGGRPTGLLAMVFTALDPNIIAHASLITTDAVAVLLIVATLYALFRWLTSPDEVSHRYAWFVATAVLLGLAQLAKVSAISLFPVLAAVIAFAELRRREPAQALGRVVALLLAMIGIAALVIWAGYGFEVARTKGIPLPVPAATHLRVYRSLGEHYDLGHPSFAFGRVNDRGWWWYFPAAFLVKTPLPTLGLLALAATLVLGRLTRGSISPRHLWRRLDASTLTLIIFPLGYAASSLLSSVNIGYRHLLPLLPFLAIGAAQAVSQLTPARGPSRLVRRTVGTVAIAWLIVGTVAALPTPLTYFNELAGGPANGYRYLVDSNLDWGQNLWDLRTWMADHGDETVRYAHYSPADPAAYGVEADFLPPDPRAVPFTPWRPEPGLYAIGATVLQGPYAPDLNTYAWFRARKPEAVLGNALFIYRVSPQPAPEWLVACTPADAGLGRSRLGLSGTREMTLDCDRAQLVPSSAGLYLAPADADLAGETSVVLMTRNASSEDVLALRQVSAPPVPPHPVPETALDGPLTFVGLGLEEEGGGVTLEAYWLVTAVPTRPLSLMAHLIGPDGAAVAVGDALDIPIEQWRPGDRIVQRHTLTPEDGSIGALEIHVGAYWLDTMTRMPLADDPEKDSIAVRIDDVHTPAP